MGDELAALAVLEGGGNADLDAELVRPMGFAFADAFDFRRMQGIDLRPALTLLLLAYAATCRRCGAGVELQECGAWTVFLSTIGWKR